MMSQFVFKNTGPDEIIRVTANLMLNRILELAPYDSTAVAVLEKLENGYRCSLDIYSRQGPFMAHVFRSTGLEALQAIEEKSMSLIKSWRFRRMSGFTGNEKISLEPVPHTL